MEQLSPQIDVSVIIVNYNAFHLLDECLNSIYAQCINTSNEIIVVDNGSDTGEVESVTRKYPDIILIKNKMKIGFSAANNKALLNVKGKYILFLNNDTKFTRDSIKTVFDYAEKSIEKLLIGIQLLNSDGSKQESVVLFPSVWNGITENLFLYKLFPESKFFNKYYQNNYDIKEPIETDVIRGAFMFCPADEIRKLNGLDERFFFYSEETDLCKRFKNSGGKIIFYPITSIIHHGGATADTNLWFKFKNQTIGKIQYYQKHFYGINFFIAIFFHWIGLLLRGIIFSISGMITLNKNRLLKGYYFFKQMFVYPVNKFN